MTPQDAMFLHVENDVTPMHIGGVSIFEGPLPAFDDLLEMVRGKLPRVPRYRQKVRFVPFSVSEPVWVDDPYFDLTYHLRHTAVPSPGSEAQLRTTAARVFSQHLDRARRHALLRCHRRPRSRRRHRDADRRHRDWARGAARVCRRGGGTVPAKLSW
jgi:Wax ester synthase/diacylglycerol acyltransferase catalytic domain